MASRYSAMVKYIPHHHSETPHQIETFLKGVGMDGYALHSVVPVICEGHTEGYQVIVTTQFMAY